MTNQTARVESLTDEDVLELLPWYVSGKTTAAESAAIAQRLSSNPRLQAEADLVRREKQVSVESVKALGEPGPDLLNQMLGQLDNVRQLPPIARDEPEKAPGFFARLFGFTPTPALRFAMVAACLLIVAETAALLKLTTGGEQAGFQTASAPEAATGPELIVRFQPDAKMSAITMLLSDLDATVVRGPMPDGAFVIGLQKDADPNAAITVLRGHADLVAGVDQGS
ncbi:hypothetical protein [Dongia sp. agr-C8]